MLMLTSVKYISYVIILVFLFHPHNIYAHDQQNFYTRKTQKPLQEIIDDTEFAITERNLRITGRLHIGEAIQERGNPDFPPYEIILYCSIAIAQKMLELSPDYINSCPGRITIRLENELYIISAPLWPESSSNKELKKLMQNMNKLVREIIEFAAEDWSFEYEK